MKGQESDVLKLLIVLEYDSSVSDIDEESSIGDFIVTVEHDGVEKSFSQSFKSFQAYEEILKEYYKSPWTKVSFILLLVFIVWIIAHGTFVIVQLRCNICRRREKHKPIQVSDSSDMGRTMLDDSRRVEASQMEDDKKKSLKLDKMGENDEIQLTTDMGMTDRTD